MKFFFSGMKNKVNVVCVYNFLFVINKPYFRNLLYTHFHQLGTKSKSNPRNSFRTMPKQYFDKPSCFETHKRSNFRFSKILWKFTPMEPILKKKWEFYVTIEILAPPVARFMILWGIDSFDHFALPHNRVCQNMTFRRLCGDPNIHFSPRFPEKVWFLLDLAFA